MVRSVLVVLNYRVSTCLVDDPIAITTGGCVTANATHVLSDDGTADPHELLRRGLQSGRRIYIGVELTPGEVAEARGRMNDAAAEVVAVCYRERG